jgi:hypothetical protein
MSRPSLDGLQLAARTPDTRVSPSNPQESPHPIIRAVAWQGGFLDGVRLRLSESLNCLVGGRGTGKSTVVESIRFALGLPAIGTSAQRDHGVIVETVLGAGTKVAMLVETISPTPGRFTIERSVPNLPVVRDAAGTVLASSPTDILGPVETFGQYVKPQASRNRVALENLVKQWVNGQRNQIIAAIQSENFSPRAFAEAARTGPPALEAYGVRGAQAANLQAAGEELFLRLEKMAVGHAAVAALNVAPAGGTEFRELMSCLRGKRLQHCCCCC